MDSITPAIIAVSGVLIVGYISNFVSEDFRRFRDGSALAAALVGELSSHISAVPAIRQKIELQLKNLNRAVIRNFDPPDDPIFDNGVEKLGLLGSEMAEETAYVYQQIRAFRLAYSIIGKESGEMGDDELVARLTLCLEAITRAANRGEPLIKKLKERADKKFLQRIWISLCWFAPIFLVLMLSIALIKTENQRYALYIGLCESGPKQTCLQSVETRTHWWWHLYYGLLN